MGVGAPYAIYEFGNDVGVYSRHPFVVPFVVEGVALLYTLYLE